MPIRACTTRSVMLTLTSPFWCTGPPSGMVIVEAALALAEHGGQPSASKPTRTATLTLQTLAAREMGTATPTSVRFTLTRPCWVTGAALAVSAIATAPIVAQAPRTTA
jgi:hypothetical protein